MPADSDTGAVVVTLRAGEMVTIEVPYEDGEADQVQVQLVKTGGGRNRATLRVIAPKDFPVKRGD